jgi:hypothetical protein
VWLGGTRGKDLNEPLKLVRGSFAKFEPAAVAAAGKSNQEEMEWSGSHLIMSNIYNDTPSFVHFMAACCRRRR